MSDESRRLGDKKVERFGWTFAPGDKVMQIENDYDKEVYNGDIGYIDDVDADAGEIVASFDGRAVTYGFGELDMLVPAYAATIHKSQGFEYPAVIIPVLTQHYAMLQRNLLYTGVTRGKQPSSASSRFRRRGWHRRWSGSATALGVTSQNSRSSASRRCRPRGVAPPLVPQCFANLECQVIDSGFVRKYNLFVLAVIEAWMDPQHKNAKTIHHHSYGRFVIDGRAIELKSGMR